MADAKVLGSGSVQVADGIVSVVRYDRVSVDHVFQNLWRATLRAKKARTSDSTQAVGATIRDHVVHAR